MLDRQALKPIYTFKRMNIGLGHNTQQNPGNKNAQIHMYVCIMLYAVKNIIEYFRDEVSLNGNVDSVNLRYPVQGIIGYS